MEKQRLKELDVFKGISILFIILLHSLCRFPIDLYDAESLQWVKSLILFVSPLACFFFASGFLFSKSRHNDNLKFIKNKAYRLLIPLFFFSIFKIILKFIASSYVRTPLEDFSHSIWGIFCGEQFWFLYSLFLIFLINKLIGKYNLIVAIILLFANLNGLLDIKLFTIDNTSYYNFFFVIGSIIGERRYEYRKFEEYIIKNRLLFSLISIVLILTGMFINLKQQMYIHVIAHLIISCLSILLIWILAICMKNSKILTHFGKYCFQYYLNHMCIILICFYLGSFVFTIWSSYSFALFIVFVVTIIISRLMLFLEKNSGIFKFIFGL